jgi:branched-chain amino acid aminotransferase
VGLHAAELRTALGTLIRQSPFAEARVRVSLDLTDSPGQLFVSIEELHLLPAAAFETGVRTISRVMHRDNPQAKLTNFIAIASGYRAQLPAGVNEMLMIDADGVILEGLSSNFFGVKHGVLYTAEAGVLPGITRAVTLELARAGGIAIELSGLRYAEWSTVAECFITSASRGVLPVVQIDEHCIGSGRPGEVTQKLMRAFNAWVERETEEI